MNYKFYQGRCFSICPDGTYEDNNKCSECEDKNCQRCTKNGCSLCRSLFYKFNKSCFQNCPTRTYSEVLTRECKNCSMNCETCENALPNACTSCTHKYRLSHGFCVGKPTNRPGKQINRISKLLHAFTARNIKNK